MRKRPTEGICVSPAVIVTDTSYPICPPRNVLRPGCIRHCRRSLTAPRIGRQWCYREEEARRSERCPSGIEAPVGIRQAVCRVRHDTLVCDSAFYSILTVGVEFVFSQETRNHSLAPQRLHQRFVAGGEEFTDEVTELCFIVNGVVLSVNVPPAWHSPQRAARKLGFFKEMLDPWKMSMPNKDR